jgi:hypothetical protein
MCTTCHIQTSSLHVNKPTELNEILVNLRRQNNGSLFYSSPNSTSVNKTRLVLPNSCHGSTKITRVIVSDITVLLFTAVRTLHLILMLHKFLTRRLARFSSKPNFGGKPSQLFVAY